MPRFLAGDGTSSPTVSSHSPREYCPECWRLQCVATPLPSNISTRKSSKKRGEFSKICLRHDPRHMRWHRYQYQILEGGAYLGARGTHAGSDIGDRDRGMIGVRDTRGDPCGSLGPIPSVPRTGKEPHQTPPPPRCPQLIPGATTIYFQGIRRKNSEVSSRKPITFSLTRQSIKMYALTELSRDFGDFEFRHCMYSATVCAPRQPAASSCTPDG